MAIKRDSSQIQDSISATELGRFPDDNVADSLSHITGVSISRTAGGEGQYVSVRGLGPEYTLTTFNGRILGTDGAGRDFAFDVLPSDIINGADVVKSASASQHRGRHRRPGEPALGQPVRPEGPARPAAHRGRPQPDDRAQRLQAVGHLQQHLRQPVRRAAGRGLRAPQASAPTRPATTAAGRATRSPTRRPTGPATPGAATST